MGKFVSFFMPVLLSSLLFTLCACKQQAAPAVEFIPDPPAPEKGAVGLLTIGDANTPLEHAYAALKGGKNSSELNVYLTPDPMSEESLKAFRRNGYPTGSYKHVHIEVKSNTATCPSTNQVGVIQVWGGGLGFPTNKIGKQTYGCAIAGASVPHNLKAISGEYELGKTVKVNIEHKSIWEPITFLLEFETEILGDFRK